MRVTRPIVPLDAGWLFLMAGLRSICAGQKIDMEIGGFV
jgi:hypothetical protein